jgi:hypothetical protein
MEHRKAQRYDLRLPLELVRRGRLPASGLGETRNLSSGGVLFKFEASLRIGDPIEYVITLLEHQHSTQHVRIHCQGKVIRVARNAEVAVTIERYEFLRANEVEPTKAPAFRPFAWAG